MISSLVIAQSNDACYLFEEDESNHDTAKSYCAEKGGQLVEINTEEENDLIISNSAVIGIPDWMLDGFWIGLKNTNGQFEWESGSELSWSNWIDDEPDGAGDCTWAYFPRDEPDGAGD